jgi:uncharacterized protein YjbJ (UPF0337 family)
MKPSTKDEIKGTFHELKGKVKEKAGQVTNNPNLADEGQAERSLEKSKKRSGKSKKCLRSRGLGSAQGTLPCMIVLTECIGPVPLSTGRYL